MTDFFEKPQLVTSDVFGMLASYTGSSFEHSCLATVSNPVIQLVYDHHAVQPVQLDTCPNQVTQLVSDHKAVQLVPTT